MRRLNVVSTLTDLERPFEEISGFQVRPGNCMLSGATKLSGGVNFTIYSENATSCELLLFRRKSRHRLEPRSLTRSSGSRSVTEPAVFIPFLSIISTLRNLNMPIGLTDPMIRPGDWSLIARGWSWILMPKLSQARGPGARPNHPVPITPELSETPMCGEKLIFPEQRWRTRSSTRCMYGALPGIVPPV